MVNKSRDTERKSSEEKSTSDGRNSVNDTPEDNAYRRSFSLDCRELISNADSEDKPPKSRESSAKDRLKSASDSRSKPRSKNGSAKSKRSAEVKKNKTANNDH